MTVCETLPDWDADCEAEPLCVGVREGETDWVTEMDCVEVGVTTCEPDEDPLPESVPVGDRVGVVDCVSLDVSACDDVPLDVGTCDCVALGVCVCVLDTVWDAVALPVRLGLAEPLHDCVWLFVELCEDDKLAEVLALGEPLGDRVCVFACVKVPLPVLLGVGALLEDAVWVTVPVRDAVLLCVPLIEGVYVPDRVLDDDGV